MDNKHIAILVIAGIIVIGIIIGVSSNVTGKTTSSRYSCDWDWWGGAGEGGQGIIYGGIRYYDCTYPEPYCKPAAAAAGAPQCCKHSSARGHYECEDAPLYESVAAAQSPCITYTIYGTALNTLNTDKDMNGDGLVSGDEICNHGDLNTICITAFIQQNNINFPPFEPIGCGRGIDTIEHSIEHMWVTCCEEGNKL